MERLIRAIEKGGVRVTNTAHLSGRNDAAIDRREVRDSVTAAIHGERRVVEGEVAGHHQAVAGRGLHRTCFQIFMASAF